MRSERAKILVVDDKQLMRDSVGATLQQAGFTVVVASDGKSALELLAKHRPAAVITDLKMPEMTGLELLQALRESDDQLPVVLMTAYGTVADAVAAMKFGAFDFVLKPFEGDQLVMTMRRAVEHRRLLNDNAVLNAALRGGDAGSDHGASGGPLTPALIGNSPAMRIVIDQLAQIADVQSTVLISGESGTGKEVIARTIHTLSGRRAQPMLCLNCAALSASLLESELFGHEKGAFTGADRLRKGRFELADEGSLLLDEISEIQPELQAKLLRVLQEGQFERVGSSTSIQVDARVIATTNRDLASYVREGGFREDLYYRLNVLPIHLPPLRQRAEDIPLLADHFLKGVARREGRVAKRFDPRALERLQSYPWPGNVRELQNICERASVLSPQEVIPASLIQPWLIAPATGFGASPVSAAAPQASNRSVSNGGDAFGGASYPIDPDRTLEEVEREQILAVLARFGGNRTRAAEALGIGLRTLGLKLKKWKQEDLIAETV